MRREKHVKSFLKRLAAGAAATLMAVTTIIANVEPMKAKADGYTLVDMNNDVWYNDAFEGVDDGMGAWTSWTFEVETPSGSIERAMCAEPHKQNPGWGSTFTLDGYYENDLYARIFFFSVGSGASEGPLAGYNENLRWIIAHHTIAYAFNDDTWNEPAVGGTFLGGPGKPGYDLCMELFRYADEHGSGDYDCYAEYLRNDDGVNQSLCIFWDNYVEPPHDGSIKIEKSSGNETITNGNSCYSLAGAEFEVYNDEDCTDYLTTLVTDENGDTDTYTVHDIPADETRTLYYKETKAPKGFLLDDAVHSITIEGEGTWTGYVEDSPETDPVTILLRKVNKETGGVSNGDGTLAGAKYVVKYYDTDKTTDPAKDGLEPKYTWKVQTDEKGRIDLTKESCYIGGDALVKIDGDISFPLGTLSIQEYEAPDGYLLDDTVFISNLLNKKVYVNGEEQTSSTSYQEASDTIIHLEQGVKGKISLKKTKQVMKDANAKAVLSSAKDTLTEAVPESGAIFQLYLKSAGSYDDAADDARDILYTDRNGLATSKDLVYGNYVLHQISGEDGFMMLDDMEVSITENGKTYQLAGNDAKKYSKLRLYKTGEVLTGYDSTNGFAYASKYVGGCTYGVYTDAECTNLIEKITTVDDTYAESKYEYLPGTYYVKELSTDGIYLLDSEVHKVEVVLDEDAEVGFTDVSLSDERQKVNIEVNKTDIDTGAVLSDTTFGVYATTDIVDRKGRVVAAKGTLLEKLVTGEDGKATAAFDYPTGYVYEVKELKAPIGYGNKNDVKKVDASAIKGNEPSQDYSLKYTDKHTSIASTKAAEYKTGDNQGAYDENLVYRIVDSVDCRDLVVGEEYTIKGILKNKATGLPFIDADGNTVTGETTFTAEAEDQIVNVEFNFKANLEGLSIVVCESLYQQGVEIYVHDSLEDKDQTIDYLKLRTKAHDKETGTNVGTVSETATIVDSVMFNNLRVGSTYEVSGYLMNKDTGSELLDKNGNRITATKKFTAETQDQTVEMEFTLDSSLLEGTTVTVFEDAYYNGVKVGTHCDITSSDQSIYYPRIRTKAVDGNTNSHVGVVGGRSTIIDTVTYTNLVVGKTYTVSGYLMNKDTNTAILDKDGNKITSSKTFVAATENGSVDITFTFDSSVMEGSTAVVFEDLLHENVRVTTHSDITDNGQSVEYPKIRTKAHDKNTGDHNGTIGPETTIIDTVTYTNLIAGREYTLKGYLVDRATQMPLRDSEGNLVSSTKNFVANNANGTVDMEFKFDSTGLGDHILVVFEDIYDTESGVKLTSHSDIGSEEQSVYYIDVKTKAHDKQTGNNVGVVTDKAVIVDTVSYNGLIVGNTYSVSGHLMIKGTGMPLLDKNGNKITAKTTFVAQTSNGTVDMVFEFDSSLLAGETVVCFEKIIHNGIEISSHEDLSDESQSVHYPSVKTTAKDTTVYPEAGVRTDDDTSLQITDTVAYKNLIPGVEYRIEGVLMDKKTGKPVANGKVKSEVTFTPTEADGSVDVVFNFARKDLDSLTVVVFENLFDAASGVKTAEHTDLNDNGQTVTFKTVVNIEKLDSTGIIKQLDGATLEILDMNGNVVFGPFITTGKATEIIGLLPDTDYILREIKAPVGFELAEDVKFKVTDSARIQHISMTDEAIIGYLMFNYNSDADWNKAGDFSSDSGSVKTGDNSHMMAYVVMMIAALSGIAALLAGKKRKNIVKAFTIFGAVVAVGMAFGFTNVAAEEYTEKQTYTSNNKDEEYSFNKTVEKNGKTFELKGVKYDAIEKKVAGNVTKNVEMRSAASTYSTADFSETIEQDGITYSLAGVEKQVTGVGARTQYQEESVHFDSLTKDDAIPQSIDSTVTDPVTGAVINVTLNQTSRRVVSTASSDEFSFDVTFYVTNGRYFRYRDNIITYDETTPNLMQYSAQMLEDLGLDSDVYNISSIDWDGDAYTQDGVLCRKAVARGSKVINDYEVVYGNNVTLPANNDAYVWVANYEAVVNEPDAATAYDITATATYSDGDNSKSDGAAVSETTEKTTFATYVQNHPAVVAGVSFFVIVLLVILFIIFLKVRKSNKHAE